MKKILYISANTKPEELSSSKTVARRLLNSLLQRYPGAELQEVDLYREHIPQLKHCYFESRSAVIREDARGELSQEEQAEIAQILKLCDQFVAADIYVLAAPMWSLSFPAPVKEYIDCILQSGKTVSFAGSKPRGLLDDKCRLFIYVQSSGAHIPWILRPGLNKGLNYVRDIMTFIGIERFEELLADGTGKTETERMDAINRASAEIDSLMDTFVEPSIFHRHAPTPDPFESEAPSAPGENPEAAPEENPINVPKKNPGDEAVEKQQVTTEYLL